MSEERRREIGPVVEFDWGGVEDPCGVVVEEIAAECGTVLSREAALAVLRWSVKRTRAAAAGELSMVELVLGWVASGRELDYRGGQRSDRWARKVQEDPFAVARRRLGLRAAVAVKVMTPHMRHALTVSQMEDVFGVSRGEVSRVMANFRELVLRRGSVAEDGEQRSGEDAKEKP